MTWPTKPAADNAALKLPSRESKPYITAFEQQAELAYTMLVRNGTLTLTFAPGQEPVSSRTLVRSPTERNGTLEWACNEGTVEARYRPPPCRAC